MRASRWVRLAALLLLAGAADTARAADVKTKAPDPAAGGEVYEWKSAGGIACRWRAPERYDAEKGVNLTLILHGTGLDRRWGFANHGHKTFRPDDFVVSPDGPTADGKAFLFLKGDTKRFHELLEELKKAMKVRAVFLYGHSQGSFFALQHAGDFPEDVTGVVAHASGIWNFTQAGKRGFHQAIVFMHGTNDPVVPYGNSAGGYDHLREVGYPILRLRSLEWWNHWPAEHNGSVPHTSQQLAWVEGMTTGDPERLAVCLDLLAKVENDGVAEHDFAGLWSLARRVGEAEDVPSGLSEKAARARKMVEALAEAHVREMGLPEKLVFEKKPWVGHLPIFLRAFQGVPAREELAEKHEAALEENRKQAVANLRKYWPDVRNGKEAEAFQEAMAAIQEGFLWHECWDPDLRKNLREWRKDAKKLKLSKAALKSYDEVFEAFDESIKDGWKAFESVNRKHSGG